MSHSPHALAIFFHQHIPIDLARRDIRVNIFIESAAIRAALRGNGIAKGGERPLGAVAATEMKCRVIDLAFSFPTQTHGVVGQDFGPEVFQNDLGPCSTRGQNKEKEQSNNQKKACDALHMKKPCHR